MSEEIDVLTPDYKKNEEEEIPRLTSFRQTGQSSSFVGQGQEIVVEVETSANERYEKILEKNRYGGCGNYQVMTTVCVLCGMLGQAFIEYNIAYLIMFPEFICLDTGDVCTAEEICDGTDSPQRQYEINYDDPFSLHNWVQQYDLICASALQLALFGQMSFLAAAITNIPVTVMSDKYGRSLIFKIGVVGQSLVFLTLALAHNRRIAYTAMFMEGFLSPWIEMVGYVYMCEFLPRKWQDYVATIYSFTYASVILILTFYFQIISNRYQWIMAVGLLQLIIASVVAFVIVESPIWYLSKGKIHQAQEATRKMCKFNGNLEQCDDLIDELAISPSNSPDVMSNSDDNGESTAKLNPSKQSYDDNETEVVAVPVQNQGACYFLKQRKICQNMGAMIFQWAMASMLYYFMSYYLIYLPGNVYNNTYASGAAEIAATLFGGVLIKVCNARWAFVISNTVALAGGLCILFFGNAFEAWMPAFVIIAKFGVSSTYMLVYAVTIDLFPTLFSATAFGTCNFVANLTTIVSPYIAQVRDPYPMLAFCTLATLGIFMSFLLILPKRSINNTREHKKSEVLE